MIGEACGEALEDTISALRPCVIVGVGTFAGGKCLEVSGYCFTQHELSAIFMNMR